MFFKTTYRAPRKCVYVQLRLEQQDRRIRFAVIDSSGKTSELREAENVAALVKDAGKNQPYILHVQGFGVLSRIAENVPGFKDQLIVNGNEEDFYFNHYESGNTIAVSFIRKSLIQDFIDELVSFKVFVWGLHLGPVPLIPVLQSDASVQLDYNIDLQNGAVRKLERNTGEQKRLAMPDGFFSTDDAYTKAIHSITVAAPELYSDGLDEDFHAETRSNYKEFLRFVKLGVGMLSVFFLALAGNYFYINYLNNVAAQLEADISGYGENLSLIDRLEQEKARKTLLLGNSGIQSSRYISFYLDEIGQSVPSAVQLETMETFPLIEALKPKRKVELNMDNINLTGYSADSKILDDWMELLENKNWVSGVELINYVRINERKASFHLLIKIKQ